jgi:hypothetical protein
MRSSLTFALVVAALAGCILPTVDSFTGGTPTSDAGKTGTDSSVVEASTDARSDATDASANVLFSDDFNRADGADPGNGWIEKRPASFDLFAGTARWLGGAVSHKDHVMYRPQTEDGLDVTVACEVTFAPNVSSPGLPQILARIQASTATTAGTLDAYTLYVNDAFNAARLGRSRGSTTVVSLASLTLAPPISPGGTYRFTLSVSGTNSVTLTSKIEEKAGATWSLIGAATFVDTDALRVPTAGAGGLSGGANGASGAYAFDNFTVTAP